MMVQATRLALLSLGLAACISTPEQPTEGEALLSIHGALDLQGSQLEGPLTAGVAFTTDFGNELRLVNGRTQGAFPSAFSFDLDGPPPSDILYALEEGEPTFAFGYITAVPVSHSTSVLLANSETGLGGCDGGVCTEVHSWCSQREEPAQDVCYTETSTCDATHQNCTLVADGDVSLKSGPWTTIAGVSKNYSVLYLSAAASAQTFTALAFAEGKSMAAGYHLLSIRSRSEAEQEDARQCYERSQQNALDRYNQKHGTAITDVIDLPYEGEDDFDQFFSAAQLELRCAQTDKVYTPVDTQQAISIQLSRSEDAFWL